MLLIALLAAIPVAGLQAATINASAKVKVVKPLAFTVKQSLNLGEVLLTGAGTGTVSLSGTGVVTCGSGLTCAGAPLPAIFNVSGSQGTVVRITAVASDLTNASDGTKLRFTPTAPASVTLTNSGAPGKDFNVGGSIAIPAATTDGLYTGNIVITVDNQ